MINLRPSNENEIYKLSTDVRLNGKENSTNLMTSKYLHQEANTTRPSVIAPLGASSYNGSQTYNNTNDYERRLN